MEFDVVIIGAGISGLTAAALLTKRGLKVCVVEQAMDPGGSCGNFKRNGCTFEQGAAMLYGFGEKGFNPHHFVMNSLCEPILMVPHKELYCVWYQGHPIHFYPEIEQYIDELVALFPSQKKNFERFYHDLFQLYQHIFIENPVYTTPDETDRAGAAHQFFKHPASYLKLLRYLNLSLEDVLKKYFTDKEVFYFFNKLTSTYCYATVKEVPAVLGAVMFIDNHYGGSYYVAGGTQFLTGALEKVIEENGGVMLYQTEVERILFAGKKVCGIRTTEKKKLYADAVVFTGTVWNLYRNLLPKKFADLEKIRKINLIEPTYPSVILFLKVRSDVIPEGTQPIEMLVFDKEEITSSEITVYIFSLVDSTLCEDGYHVIEAIGPSFQKWNCGKKEYQHKKRREIIRMLSCLSKRFPKIKDGLIYAELATPRTIERYTMKNHGAVAGPKQMIGQHMLRRLHTKSQWAGLYFAGESTVMGTGTPSVTTSGISAANAVLKQYQRKPYLYQKQQKSFVKFVDGPVTEDDLLEGRSELDQKVMRAASVCLFCESPACCDTKSYDIRGMLRRAACGNLSGAVTIANQIKELNRETIESFSRHCVLNDSEEKVKISTILQLLWQRKNKIDGA